MGVMVYQNTITLEGVQFLGDLLTGQAPEGERFAVLRLYNEAQDEHSDKSISFSYQAEEDELVVRGSAVWEEGETTFAPYWLALRSSEGREIAVADISEEGLEAGDPAAFTRRDVFPINVSE